MTETVGTLALSGVNPFRASELTIARSIRDYIHFYLHSDAETILTAINAELNADSQVSIPDAYEDASTFLDFSQTLPKNPPFIHVLVPRWRRMEGHRKVRIYDAFVVMVTGWEVPEKIAIGHGVVAEALSLMFTTPLKERLMTAEAITDIRIEEVLAQEASASELGYALAGGEGEPDTTLLRETQFSLSVIKREPYDGVGGGGGGFTPVTPPTPTTARVGVAWSTDDMIDAAEIAALVTSTGRTVEIPALPAGRTNARLILWTADASGTISGVSVTRQFGDQFNLFDNANAQAETVESQAGMARITVNPLGAAYVGQMLTVNF